MLRNDDKESDFVTIEELKKFLDETTRELSRLEAAGKTKTTAYEKEIEKFAEMIVSISRKAFLQLDDLLNTRTGDKQPKSQQNYANTGENIANLVIASIQSQNFVEDQAKVYSRWVLIQEKCEQAGDIFASLQIGGGLSNLVNNSARKLIPKTLRAKQDAFDERQYGHANHGLKSFRALAKENPETIPYFGIYRGRLTLSNDAKEKNEELFYAMLVNHLPPPIISIILNDSEFKKIGMEFIKLAEEIKVETNPIQLAQLSKQKIELEAKQTRFAASIIVVLQNEYPKRPELHKLVKKIQRRDKKIAKITEQEKGLEVILEQEKKQLHDELTKSVIQILESSKKVDIENVNAELVTQAVTIVNKTCEAEFFKNLLLSKQRQLRAHDHAHFEKQKNQSAMLDTQFMSKPSNPKLLEAYLIRNYQRTLQRFLKNLAEIGADAEKLTKSTENLAVKELMGKVAGQITILDANKRLATHTEIEQFETAYGAFMRLGDDIRAFNQKLESQSAQGDKKNQPATGRLSELFFSKKKEVVPTLLTIAQAIYANGNVQVALNEIKEHKEKNKSEFISTIAVSPSVFSESSSSSSSKKEVSKEDSLEPINVDNKRLIERTTSQLSLHRRPAQSQIQRSYTKQDVLAKPKGSEVMSRPGRKKS